MPRYASSVGTKTVDALTTSYDYDDANQLTSESNTGYSASYSYDANGNRASQTINGTTYTYTNDNADKLTYVKIGGTTVKSFSYDAAGRTTGITTSAGTTSLSYDYESRVTGITYPSSATNSFSYNGLDARVGKVDSAGTSTYKRDGASAVAPVLSDGTAAYTPAVSRHASSATTFEGGDYEGTNRVETNSSQSVSGTRLYDAFGNLESTTGSPAGPFGYVGQAGYQEDSDSGLKLLSERYYDASTGRFLTRDHTKNDRNWTTYCANNPTRYIDATGDTWQGVAVGVCIIALAVVLAPETGGLSVVIYIGAGTLAGAANAGTDYAVDYSNSGGSEEWNPNKFWQSIGWGALGGFCASVLTAVPVVEWLSPWLKGLLRGPKFYPGISGEEGRALYYGGNKVL